MKGKGEKSEYTENDFPKKAYDANAGRLRDTTEAERTAAAQRANRRRNRGASERAEWRNADSARLLAAVAAVTRYGYAIRFGYTKDHGAFAIGIIGDGEPFTEFVRPTEDIDLYLDDLVSDYNGRPDNDFAANVT